jgi:hypothetical protein
MIYMDDTYGRSAAAPQKEIIDLLTDPKLRSQVDALWDKFWTGGFSNPLDTIEQFS